MNEESANSGVVVLGTGGTIAGIAERPGDHVGYAAAQIGVEQLLDDIAPLAELLTGRRLVCEQVSQIDSKDMRWAVWRKLAQRCSDWLADSAVKGIVITHGTDTVEETAWFLQTVLQPLKPVVLTCAMRPATALAPDGPQNLVDAIGVVLDEGTTGVMVVCAGVVHAARRVQKVHPYRLDAFDSGSDGPLGFVEQGRVRWCCTNPVRSNAFAPIRLATVLKTETEPWVEIVMNHEGADGRLVDALVAAGVQGLVAAGTGNGSLNVAREAALLRAQVAGVMVVRATRCPLGRVVAVSGDLLQDSNGLSPVKARISLMLSLLV